jgi:hypothetical protein
MALASKKTGTIHSKSSTDKTRLKNKFDGGALDHLADNPDDFPQNAAMIYAMQNITEDIDSLRTYVGTELRNLISTNTSKTPLTIGTGSGNAMAGNTTVISSAQATLITALAKGVTNGTGHPIKFTLNESGALVIAIDRSTFTISADR